MAWRPDTGNLQAAEGLEHKADKQLGKEAGYHYVDKVLACSNDLGEAGEDVVGDLDAELAVEMALMGWLCIVDLPYLQAHLVDLLGTPKIPAYLVEVVV